MKKLPLKSKQYQQLEKDYKDWLNVLGYAQTTVESLPIYVRELLHYLEQQGKATIQQTTEQDIKTFLFHWKQRKNQTTGAGLSSTHINKGILAYNKFIKFLRITGRHQLEISLQREENNYHPRVILTRKEIKVLYESTYHLHNGTDPLVYGQRDRAMLAVFYGCGLRNNEGVNIDVEDILLDKRLIYVKKGKGNKQRYVPLTGAPMKDIIIYLEEGRKWFLEDHHQSAWHRKCNKPFPPKSITHSQAFLLNLHGKRLQQSGLWVRLKMLAAAARINKQIALHTLRHSIATHLLQEGMELELIGKFLGHSTLESTQIYTHIVNELQYVEQ